MDTNRRTIMGGAAATALGLSGAASAAAAAPSLAALKAAGLDPYTTYRRMFSSAANNAECVWWYLGLLPITVPDVGDVGTAQAATLMAYLTEDEGKDTVHVTWKEIGSFRDIATGAVATPWINPMTGKTEPRRVGMEDGPGRYTIRRSGDDVTIALDQKGAVVKAVLVNATIEGDRVCLTQTEEKTRTVTEGAAQPIRTTLKIYASLADLKGSAPNVTARGFYSVLRLASGTYNVTGMIEKAAMDRVLNRVEWDRMKGNYPGYFTGDRFAPKWK